MRTTVNLPDDVYKAARSVAAVREISLGVTVLPKDSPLITLEHTLVIEDDID